MTTPQTPRDIESRIGVHLMRPLGIEPRTYRQLDATEHARSRGKLASTRRNPATGAGQPARICTTNTGRKQDDDVARGTPC